ncbi:MAG: M20/M25/M40 family metallo-hydrolase, partial [Myxococcales bacterium]|nr:M20/M25/M40 family metallo-hydrolase [Myxococcales bacterium]
METLAEVTRGRTDAMLEAIRELVEQSSHTADKAGGDAVASLLAERATGLGLGVTRIASERFADHLVIASPAAARSAEGAVVFVGHHDTVFPRGSFEGFTRDATIARGPGVLDMKGGIVVMLEAVRAVQQAGGLPRLKLRIVLVGDEEVGSPEGRAVIQTHTKGASQALVFEAGRAADKIITSRKGTGSATVIATGKAAHAANGHREGVNAIWALARFIDRAQRLT